MKVFISEESGATAIEYALIAVLIATFCVVSIAALGGSNGGMWETKIKTPVVNATK